ncbi:PLP-dependent aminotransferase family protein [Spartinivicinus poritis]|uniref:PLP-dependent aminotransferase family protein n=1 Tax=Spartinivicinus poritis TaxID=2994640 RepID=A0ABT5UDE7_9GAMM|nr:PLP-dependent aminotransferase family protein [Spartinivicinus sp. A2-2]MDE1464393.1 PLP-dependent aminotransferase family protein [Spartinivicinus sp. A2-2]
MKQPIYQQLAEQLAEQIKTGVYQAGQKLPSVRGLAKQMNISITSVMAAYNCLEAQEVIEARYKSGFYVKPQVHFAAPQAGDCTTLPTPESVTSSQLIIDLVASAADGKYHQFSVANPAADLPANEPLRKSFTKLIRQRYSVMQRNTDLQGTIKLRQQLTRILADAGIMTTPDNIIITTGCQSAMMLCLRALAKPGDIIAISSPAYYRILQLLEALELKVLEIPSHPKTGIDLTVLENMLSQWPVKALITCPNFANPLGDSMPIDHQQQLMEIAVKYHTMIIEDDVFGELGYQKERPKALKALDKSGQVLYCSSASKSISPQLKTGWLVVDEHKQTILYQQLLMGLAPPMINQLSLADYLMYGNYHQHLSRARQHYQQRYYQALSLLQKYFPANIRLSSPTGGFVLWVELPKSCDTTQLYFAAKEKGILIAPGELFSVNPEKYKHCFRINFSQPWEQSRIDAIKTLGSIIKQQHS